MAWPEYILSFSLNFSVSPCNRNAPHVSRIKRHFFFPNGFLSYATKLAKDKFSTFFFYKAILFNLARLLTLPISFLVIQDQMIEYGWHLQFVSNWGKGTTKFCFKGIIKFSLIRTPTHLINRSTSLTRPTRSRQPFNGRAMPSHIQVDPFGSTKMVQITSLLPGDLTS